MSGIVGSRLNIRGSGTVGGLGTDGQVLTSSGDGQEIVFESASGGAVSAINSATANELVTIGSTTTELDAESGLTYTDGALVIGGTTPSLTIGDAGAEDTKIVFDGNAQDFHIGLDDSSDDLVIGLGSTLGTTTHMSFDETGAVLKPLQPAFLAVPSGTTTWNMQQQAALPFVTEVFDQNGDYNTSTYKFTAPVTGKYQFSVTFDTASLDSSASWWNLALATSNRTYGQAGSEQQFDADPTYYGAMCATSCADMDANDTVFIQFYQANGANQLRMGAFGGGHFGGCLVA